MNYRVGSGQGPAAALSSSDLAEDQKKGGQQPQQQPPAAASASSDDGAAQEASTSKSSSIKKPRDPTKVRDALVWIDLEMTGGCRSSSMPGPMVEPHTN